MRKRGHIQRNLFREASKIRLQLYRSRACLSAEAEAALRSQAFPEAEGLQKARLSS